MGLHLPDGLMTSVSGFRGRIGDCLTPELIAALAAAYGTFLRAGGDEGPVVVARDSRTSGPMLMRAAVAGLLSSGARVVEIGLAPTPTLMLAVSDLEAAGGLAITASHNPAEWNALKFAVRGGTFLPPARMADFRAWLAGTEHARRASWDGICEVERDETALTRHLEGILALPFLDVEAVRACRLRVAVDCVNGAGVTILPALLERLGCTVAGIGMEPHGRFHRNPEPTGDALAALGEHVQKTGAAIGMAVDPDADRLSLVDERGRALGEDLTLALAADVVLGRRTGPVVTNLSTSRVVDDVAARHGCRAIRSPVGEIHVVERMKREGAVVGGEGNGGVIIPALHRTRDALLGAALLVQLLADEPGLPLSERVARLPSYRIVKEKVAFPRDRLAEAFADLERALPGDERDDSDGLRIAWRESRSWLHVRPSGTEPVVRLIAEAGTGAEARARIERARAILARVGATA